MNALWRRTISALGQFDLTGIPPAPRGIPQVDVTFDINADGILNVSAKDLATGKQMGIRIAASTKLGPTEKNRMIREAEQFNEQDKRAKEEAEIRNTADSVIYTTEKTLAEIGDKLAQEQKAKIQEALQSLKGSLKTGGLAEISSKVDGAEKSSSRGRSDNLPTGRISKSTGNSKSGSSTT